MTKPILVFLASLGCALMLAFTSLTSFRMMSRLWETMQPESQVSDVTSMAPVGGLGAAMFGLGMMSLTLMRRRPSLTGRMLLVFAALLMTAGAWANLVGDWLMMTAFHTLATAESIDAEAFLDSFRSATIFMLVGYVLLLAATADIAAAATMMKTQGSNTTNCGCDQRDQLRLPVADGVLGADSDTPLFGDPCTKERGAEFSCQER